MKLLLAMAFLMSAQAQAGLLPDAAKYLRTTVRCVSAEDANVMYARTLRENQPGATSMDMLDYTFHPVNNAGNKNLVITKKGTNETVANLNLGISDSSSVNFPLTMNDGDKFQCIILMEKTTDVAPIALP